MKVLVCFKVTASMEQVLLSEAEAICKGENPFQFAPVHFSGEDEAALEAALRLKDNNRAVQLTAATVGACQDRFFSLLFALGFHECVQLNPDVCVDFNPSFTMFALQEFVKASGSFDLILTGTQAGPGENGTVPGTLAASLQLPYYPKVISLEQADESHIRLVSLLDKKEETVVVKKGVVCAMGNALYPHLRTVNLKDRLAAKNKTPDTFCASKGKEMEHNHIRVQRESELSKRECRFICPKPEELGAFVTGRIQGENV